MIGPPIAANGAEHERGAGRGWQSADRHSSRDSPTMIGLLIASVWGARLAKSHFPNRHFLTNQVILGGKEPVVSVDERGRDGPGYGRRRAVQGDAPPPISGRWQS